MLLANIPFYNTTALFCTKNNAIHFNYTIKLYLITLIECKEFLFILIEFSYKYDDLLIDLLFLLLLLRKHLLSFSTNENMFHNTIAHI